MKPKWMPTWRPSTKKNLGMAGKMFNAKLERRLVSSDPELEWNGWWQPDCGLYRSGLTRDAVVWARDQAAADYFDSLGTHCAPAQGPDLIDHLMQYLSPHPEGSTEENDHG